MADRDRYYGDPNFAKIPMTELLSKSYATLRRPLIDPFRASLAQQPGDPTNMKAILASAVQTVGRASAVPAIERANDTTCVNVIDKDGNLFSATPSGAWLPAVVAGDTGLLDGPTTSVGTYRPKQSKRRSAWQTSKNHTVTYPRTQRQ